MKSAAKKIKQDEITSKMKNSVAAIWGLGQWESFSNLIVRESGNDPWVVNQKSHACGIFQALPCSKIGGRVYWNEEMGKWRLDPESAPVDKQIEWGMNYIKQRYGSPDAAYAHWLRRVPVKINGVYQDAGHWY